MAKTIDQLQAEIEKKEAQLSQERHKEQRLKNRLKYYEKGERGKRTHRLCNLGGTVESLAPEIKELTRTEMYELMEYIFSLPEVQRAVRHMAITHIWEVIVIGQVIIIELQEQDSTAFQDIISTLRNHPELKKWQVD